MPIITKPSPLEKNATGVFSLDKTALALHPTVVASAHFSSPNVWEKVIVKYKSDTLGQFESIEFDATIASPEGQFFVSATAEDIFEVEKITIIDKDGAILLIPRADLTVAEFDIDFSAGIPQSVPVMWLANPAYVLEIDGGATASATRPSYGDFSITYADPSQWVTGDFTLEAVLNSNYNQGSNFIGFYESTTPTITTAFTGSSIYFEQAVVASYQIPAGSTYTVKIQRIGLNVKFYVNNVEKFSGTHTDINKAKVPFFTFTNSDKYIASAIIILPEAPAAQLSWNNSSSGYVIESDNGVMTTVQRSSGPTYDVVYGNNESFVTGDFIYEAEISTSLQSESLVGFYDSVGGPYNTFVSGGANLNFLITSPWNTLATSVAKPVGNTFMFKITRVGTAVRLFVNNVEVASNLNTTIEHLKVPFFSLRPNDYIVSATITEP
jgi:hypothetical protein